METNADYAPAADSFDPFSQQQMEKEIENVAVKKAMDILASPYYDILFGTTYRGDDDRVMDLIHHCEITGGRIREATDITTLRFVVSIIDTTLLQQVPPMELRHLLGEILERDKSLIAHMPQLKARLMKLCCAIEMNEMLQPDILSAIIRDVAAKNLMVKGHG